MDHTRRYTFVVLVLFITTSLVLLYCYSSLQTQDTELAVERSHFARHHAAYDHRCPFEKVKLIGRNARWDDVMLNVCGQQYEYKLVGAVWIEKSMLYERRLNKFRRKRR